MITFGTLGFRAFCGFVFKGWEEDIMKLWVGCLGFGSMSVVLGGER